MNAVACQGDTSDCNIMGIREIKMPIILMTVMSVSATTLMIMMIMIIKMMMNISTMLMK